MVNMCPNSVYKRGKVEEKKQSSHVLPEQVIILRRRNKSGAKERRRKKKEFIMQPCIQLVAGMTLAKAGASHISQWTELLRRAREQIVFAFPGIVLFIFIFVHLI